MNTYYQQFLDLLFPRLCVGCGLPGRYICASCKKQLVPHPDHCPFCHRVMAYGQTCYDCLPQHRQLTGVMVAFVYTEMIKRIILDLKFFHRYDVAGFLSERLSLLLQTNPYIMKAKEEKKLFVTYVPSHRRKKWIIKGYNQSELLAKHVAESIQVPIVQGLKKQKYTPSQTTRTRRQRLTNLIGAFTTTTMPIIPEGATLLIIDDITTTGATLDQVAKQRKIYYHSLQIWGVVIGRHGK